jgi:hypothetical protein
MPLVECLESVVLNVIDIFTMVQIDGHMVIDGGHIICDGCQEVAAMHHQ